MPSSSRPAEKGGRRTSRPVPSAAGGTPELDRRPLETEELAESVGLTDEFERAPLLVAGVQDLHLSALPFESTARL
jgi:hypothetical protein